MDSLSSRHIPSLDGIRAAAAVTVFASHAIDTPYIPSGLGVTIFFFLSGYLITTLLRREYAATGKISLKNFYIRRACRIFPPMYFMLALILLFTVVAQGTEAVNGAALSAQLLHLTNYYIVLAGSEKNLLPYTSVLWSLAVEEHFYLVFPVVLLLLLNRMSRRSIVSLLITICLAVLAWRFLLVLFAEVPDAHIFYATDARLDSLLFGCIMALWFNPVLDFALPPSRHTPSVSEKGMMVLALGLLAISLLYRDPIFHKTLRYSVEGVALWALFWLAIRYPRWLPLHWLNWSPVRGLGGISYTFYLSHPLWIDVARAIAPGWTAVVLAFGLTTLFSTLLYWHLERPFLKLGKTLQSGAWSLRLKEPT
jgi:peptidoglycan/LPS O-acetylase OafA/YrhL